MARKAGQSRDKTVQSVKNSLKFKAEPKKGVLTVRLGVKKLVLPVEARLLHGEGYMFLSFSSSSEIYRIDGKALAPMDSGEDATAAYEALNPKRRRRGRRTRQAAEMPEALANALKLIPAGYKLVHDATGAVRLAKTRVRRKNA